jgi:hypothetical protein
VYEPWLITPAVTQFVASAFGAPPFYSPVPYDVFLMPPARTISEVLLKVKRKGRYPAGDLWPALTPVIEAMSLRQRIPHLAIFTIVKPINVSRDDKDYDTAAAWKALR